MNSNRFQIYVNKTWITKDKLFDRAWNTCWPMNMCALGCVCVCVTDNAMYCLKHIEWICKKIQLLWPYRRMQFILSILLLTSIEMKSRWVNFQWSMSTRDRMIQLWHFRIFPSFSKHTSNSGKRIGGVKRMRKRCNEWLAPFDCRTPCTVCGVLSNN